MSLAAHIRFGSRYVVSDGLETGSALVGIEPWALAISRYPGGKSDAMVCDSPRDVQLIGWRL